LYGPTTNPAFRHEGHTSRFQDQQQLHSQQKDISEHNAKKNLAEPYCGLSGTLREGDARGNYDTIFGVETYVATPKEDRANGNIVLYFPNVWGLFKMGS